MSKHTIAKFCALTAGLSMLPGVSYAGKEVKEVIEKCKESCITGDIGINVVSQYVSRGVIFENQGGIIEPYADLYFKMYEGEGFLNKAVINLGIWNSFHSRHTDMGIASGATTSSTRAWYEFDFTAGVSFTFAKNFTFTPSYYTFLSPNDGFSTFQGLNLKLAYDDTDLLGAFADRIMPVGTEFDRLCSWSYATEKADAVRMTSRSPRARCRRIRSRIEEETKRTRCSS